MLLKMDRILNYLGFMLPFRVLFHVNLSAVIGRMFPFDQGYDLMTKPQSVWVPGIGIAAFRDHLESILVLDLITSFSRLLCSGLDHCSTQ